MLRQLRLATENCVPGNGTPRLADVFLAWRERLLLYGDYCSNLTNAQDTLKALDSRDSTFSKQLAVSGFCLIFVWYIVIKFGIKFFTYFIAFSDVNFLNIFFKYKYLFNKKVHNIYIYNSSLACCCK